LNHTDEDFSRYHACVMFLQNSEKSETPRTDVRKRQKEVLFDSGGHRVYTFLRNNHVSEQWKRFTKGCTTAGVFFRELFLWKLIYGPKPESFRERRAPMKAVVNGKQEALPEKMTVSDLLEEKKMRRNRIAVEINRNIVPRADYDRTVIHDGDVIEVVSFMGGG
jgi:sulfur carrier protein